MAWLAGQIAGCNLQAIWQWLLQQWQCGQWQWQWQSAAVFIALTQSNDRLYVQMHMRKHNCVLTSFCYLPLPAEALNRLTSLSLPSAVEISQVC